MKLHLIIPVKQLCADDGRPTGWAGKLKRPGLSGLAQVYLKRDCGPRARYHYDMLYVRRASSLGDLKIVWPSLLDVMTFRLSRGHRRPRKLRQR